MVDISGLISSNQYATNIQQAENTYGIPSGLLGALGYAESSLGANGSGGNGGGWGQFTSDTWDEFGQGNMTSIPDNINSSGSYLSYLYNKTGSWVSALQSYGTLPKNLSNLNEGQQNAYNIASSADNGGSWSTWLQNPVSGLTNWLSGKPYSSGAVSGGANLNDVSTIGQNLGTIASDFTAVINWFKSLSGSNIAIGFIVIVVAIILLILGIADLAFGQKPAQVVSTVKKGLVE